MPKLTNQNQQPLSRDLLKVSFGIGRSLAVGLRFILASIDYTTIVLLLTKGDCTSGDSCYDGSGLSGGAE